MKKHLTKLLLCIGAVTLPQIQGMAQVTLSQDYKNYNSSAIGTFQGINFREAGFSGMFAVPGTNGREFWVCSDRGVNVDAANANPTGCTPTYDKIYGFPGYAPKIHRIRVNGDSVQILQTITMKRPDGTTATGLLNPTGFGSTATEQASTDTVLDCTNYAAKIAAKDVWGIDAEGIVVDRDGNFWVCEEGGPTIWKMSPNGVVLKRFTPYAALAGPQPIDVAIDTVYKYRKNNRGFEGISIAPNGKIYAIIQSPILYPTKTVGENSRVHRVLEIDPATNATRMFAYLNDGIIGASGANQIRLRDWKIGDMAAINDTTFLVMEAALRGTTDIKRIYKINISTASTVTSGLYGGLTLEALLDSAGLAANGIIPVKKTLFIDLLANGWNPLLEKAEGLSIINDSTIAVANDNDYGQVSLPENGIATATTNLSHVVKYSLQGANKLVNFQPSTILLSVGVTGPSSSQTPYLVPTVADARFTSILTATDVVGGYKMCGTPDGSGLFDNNDGTFTLLMNHEFGNTAGVARAHGSIGSFVSKWVINKSTLAVVSGADLIQNINLWNTATSSYVAYNSSFPSTSAALNRFCSGDLPAVTAFYNAATGKGTQQRIFMNGEEAGNEGRAFGHIATGADAGKSYELPYLGKFSWENSVASAIASDTTVVIGMDDATPGQVYVYVGNKTNAGTDIDKAGLNNGKLFGVTVSGLLSETSSSVPAPNTAFTLTDMGDVHNMTGTALNNASNTAGVTTFLRPEDGAWDPSSPNDFYFATTNSFTSPSRLWRLRFTDATKPALGGTITAVLDGTEGQKMLDNLTIDNYGHILLVEDVGSNAHVGKVWQYTIATDALVQVGAHDTTRFQTGGANFLTIDEEASGIIDAERILGPGMFLTVDQAHYAISGEVVEGGQLLAYYNPATFNAAPEVAVKGNGVNIADGSIVTAASNNTNFGSVYTGSTQNKTFVIKNTGAGALSVSGINITGVNASEYTLIGAPTFPLTLAANDSQSINIRFAPLAGGSRTATINIVNSDIDESHYDFAVAGNGIDSPEVNVTGNSVNIINGDLTPGTANNTDFGAVALGSNNTRTFVIQNLGYGTLSVAGINFTGVSATDFTVVGAPSFPIAVAMADSFTVTVRFTPSATGIRSAAIGINTNDADETNYSFAIQGAGTGTPEINVQGNSTTIFAGDVTPGVANNTDFGNVQVGTTRTQNFVIQNTGAGPLSISAITFAGINASEFTLYGAPVFPVTIPANGNQPIVVQFQPMATATRNAIISIANTDADEATYDFALGGNGLTPAGITSVNGGTSLRVYPNPARDEAAIAVALKDETEVTITVVDVQGKEVLPAINNRLSAGEQIVTVNTSALQNGIYFVRVSDGVNTTNLKMVVMH
ncbi:choice-of-anchor D domain-containing protein [Flavipsychrobacter stenotrophus]|nr:choice-of-anchor D domain-containing protein [Flavipsychrobacter stenotrophus]